MAAAAASAAGRLTAEGCAGVAVGTDTTGVPFIDTVGRDFWGFCEEGVDFPACGADEPGEGDLLGRSVGGLNTLPPRLA